MEGAAVRTKPDDASTAVEGANGVSDRGEEHSESREFGPRGLPK